MVFRSDTLIGWVRQWIDMMMGMGYCTQIFTNRMTVSLKLTVRFSNPKMASCIFSSSLGERELAFTKALEGSRNMDEGKDLKKSLASMSCFHSCLVRVL